VAQWRNALRESGLDRAALIVGLVLSTYMNAHGRCWPAKDTIAADSRLSRRATDTAVLRLEAAGFLEVGRTKGGKSSTNDYQATLPTRRQLQGWERLTPQNRTPNPAGSCIRKR
jgi:Helix-turn-helix domain